MVHYNYNSSNSDSEDENISYNEASDVEEPSDQESNVEAASNMIVDKDSDEDIEEKIDAVVQNIKKKTEKESTKTKTKTKKNVKKEDSDSSDEDIEEKIDDVVKKTANKKTKKEVAKTAKKRISAYNKKKSFKENLNILLKKFGIEKDAGEYNIKNTELLARELKKKTTLFSYSYTNVVKNIDLKKLSLIIVDNDEKDGIVNDYLLKELEAKNKDIIIIKTAPYLLFKKIFFEINSNVINFTLLQTVILLAFISKRIYLCNQFCMSNYIFYKLFGIIDLENKINFVNHDKKIFETDSDFDSDIKNNFTDFVINRPNIIDVINNNDDKNNLSYKDKTVLEFFKTVNFNTQLKNESFDGLTKFILSIMKNKKTSSFNFISIFEKLNKEYPNISEKEILKHYIYIIENLSNKGDIPLFSFEGKEVTKNKVIKINKNFLEKLSNLTVIIEKKNIDFWICLIPVQLFYKNDFFNLDLKKVLNTLIKDFDKKKSFSLISDNLESLFMNASKEAIEKNKNIYTLKLSGHDKNMIKGFIPICSKDDVVAILLKRDIQFELENNGIIIKNPETLKNALNFSHDKKNLIFDYNTVSTIYDLDPKSTKYEAILKYYNSYLKTNLKMFKTCMLIWLLNKSENQDLKNRIKKYLNNKEEVVKEKHAVDIDIDFDMEKMKCTIFNNFVSNDINMDSYDSDIISYIKNEVCSLFTNFNN